MADALVLALWVMVAAVVGIAGTYGALRVRRWSRREVQQESFTLQDLRAMRDRRELTEQEFQALRGQVLGRAITGDAPASRPRACDG